MINHLNAAPIYVRSDLFDKIYSNGIMINKMQTILLIES